MELLGLGRVGLLWLGDGHEVVELLGKVEGVNRVLDELSDAWRL